MHVFTFTYITWISCKTAYRGLKVYNQIMLVGQATSNVLRCLEALTKVHVETFTASCHKSWTTASSVDFRLKKRMSSNTNISFLYSNVNFGWLAS